jgi:hypothetical protein
MGTPGTCDGGCREVRLDLVRAGAYDSVMTADAAAGRALEAFIPITRRLAAWTPGPGAYETAYRELQAEARAALRRHPPAALGLGEINEPSEPATTWWCPACGGIDAPQPCLGVCVWRPVEWVTRERYERARETVLEELERERPLRGLLRRIAFATPRPDHWEESWRVLRAEALRSLAS